MTTSPPRQLVLGDPQHAVSQYASRLRAAWSRSRFSARGRWFSSAVLDSTAVRMTQPRGTVILKSTMHGTVPVDTAPVIVNEITLVGSRCGRFEPALALLRDKKVDVSPLIATEFGLDQACEAFAEAARPGVLKVLLRNSQRLGTS